MDTNVGIAAALDRGIVASSGELIARMDADIYASHKLMHE